MSTSMIDHTRALDGVELDRIMALAERLRAEQAGRIFARMGRAVRDWAGRQAQREQDSGHDQTPAHGSHLSGW